MRFRITLLAAGLTLFVPFLSVSQSAGDYRSVSPGGTWTTASNWEIYDGANWMPASASPTSADGVITILSGHMTIAGALTIDQTVLEAGTGLTWTSGALIIGNGTGIDFVVNGTLTDASTTSIAFSSGATWSLGTAATIIRTQNTSSNNWQNAYEAGNSNIPPTSTWICRKTGGATPSITSINAFYGNLILENTSGGAWSTNGGNNFQGSSGFATIKGDFDIGGSSSTTAITFTTGNTNASPVVVEGSLIVRASHTLTNNGGGRGFEVHGEVNIDGTLDNDNGAAGVGLLRFAGSNVQSISGTGTIQIREMVLNKASNHAYLQRDLSPNNLTLTAGNVVLGSYTLTIPPSGTITGGSATTFVQTDGSGVLRRTVASANIAFPVGNSTYNPLTMSNAGTSDLYDIRVFDEVLANGTAGAAFTSDVVNRTWLIAEGVQDGGNLNISVQWDAGDELSGFDRTNCYVSHYLNTGWNSTAGGLASGTNPYIRFRSGITSIGSPSAFAVASNGLLPIELAGLSAVAQKQEVLLTWETKTERDNAFFAVERSTDGIRFTEIGQKPGAGTSVVPHDYRFTDFTPSKGNNYYRLRQVDMDGHFTYSPVVTALIATNRASLFPSIATDVVHVHIEDVAEEPSMIWQVFDYSGKLLQSGVWEDPNQYQLNVNDLPQGQYLLRFMTGQQAPVLLRFQKAGK